MSTMKTIQRSIRYAIVYWFVKFLIWSSIRVPRRRWLSFCGMLGSLAYYFARETRQLTLRHLTMAFPEKNAAEIRALAKRTFKMLGKNSGDVLRSSGMKTLTELYEFVVLEGLEHFEAARAKGKGVVFIACHLGAFDLEVTCFAMQGFNPHIVGTPLKDRRLNDLLWGYRNANGAIAVERGKETFRMIKVLKSGGSVALLIDQDTNVKKVFVDFFGMPAATPVGATVLAMKTGAAALPTYIYLGDDGLQHMFILPEITLRNTGDEEADTIYNTQLFTTFIEEKIRQHPDQWVWMHERWKTKPE
jgi:KDO2-lipid IV(A) lauroyltransferase